jgi:transcriptional regulator with XRE-family HTH domain
MQAQRNVELADFLRTRRSRLQPEEVGLPSTSRRRVQGLRREELAQLAGLSADYYTRLEQGRHPSASPAVLDSLARALRLPADERLHLFDLAQVVDAKRAAGPDPAIATSCPGGDEAGRRVLDIFGTVPAVLCGPFSDMVAANDAAQFIYDTEFDLLPAAERNTLLWILTSPTARDLYRDAWESSAAEMIGKLRAETGQHPRHPRAQELVSRLHEVSPLFRQVWQQHEVSSCVQGGVKTLHHRLDGTFRMRADAVTMHSSPTQVCYVLLPADDSFERAFMEHQRGQRGRSPADKGT